MIRHRPVIGEKNPAGVSLAPWTNPRSMAIIRFMVATSPNGGSGVSVLHRNTRCRRLAALVGPPRPDWSDGLRRFPHRLPEWRAVAFLRQAADVATDWLDADTFEALLSPAALPGRPLKHCLQSDSVLRVWIAERKLYLFPQWQLDPAGTPWAGLSAVLALLLEPYGVSSGEPTSGWEEIEWLVAPHALLSGAKPSEVLVLDPDLVMAVAKQEFSSSSDDGRW